MVLDSLGIAFSLQGQQLKVQFTHRLTHASPFCLCGGAAADRLLLEVQLLREMGKVRCRRCRAQVSRRPVCKRNAAVPK